MRGWSWNPNLVRNGRIRYYILVWNVESGLKSYIECMTRIFRNSVFVEQIRRLYIWVSHIRELSYLVEFGLYSLFGSEVRIETCTVIRLHLYGVIYNETLLIHTWTFSWDDLAWTLEGTPLRYKWRTQTRCLVLLDYFVITLSWCWIILSCIPLPYGYYELTRASGSFPSNRLWACNLRFHCSQRIWQGYVCFCLSM